MSRRAVGVATLTCVGVATREASSAATTLACRVRDDALEMESAEPESAEQLAGVLRTFVVSERIRLVPADALTVYGRGVSFG